MEWKEEQVVKKTPEGGVVRFVKSTPLNPHRRVLRWLRIVLITSAAVFLLCLLMMISDSGGARGEELSEKTTLSVETEGALIVFDEKATASLKEAAGRRGLTVRLNKETALEGREKYRLEIRAGTEALTTIGEGKLFVRLPYVPESGAEENTIIALVRAQSASEPAPAAAGIYRPRQGTVDFIVSDLFTECEVGTRTKYYGDVEETAEGLPHWARDSIVFLAAREVIDGQPDGSFDPEGKTTRAQLMKLLFTLAGEKVSDYRSAPQEAISEALAGAWAAGTKAELERAVSEVNARYGIEGTGTSFADVPYYEWYAPYVNWAVEKKIASGVTPEFFDPEGEVSRQQAAVFLKRFVYELDFLLPKQTEETMFSDQEAIEFYARDAVKELRMAGIIGGREDGSFDPNAGVTRGEICRMLEILTKEYVTASEVSRWFVVEL